MSGLLSELTDTDHELFHYETHPKIQMEKIPEKGQRKCRVKINPDDDWKVSNDGHNHIRRSTVMQHQIPTHI